jgi:acetylornithine deacetylase/succinyl-diaminopimelate desuccinylase-like protein
MQSDLTGTRSWQGILEENRQHSIDELIEILRIPSISTSNDNLGDVKDMADWVAKRLERAGMEHIEVAPTGPHACVYGDWLHAPGKPTILIYGHFDVQPADPLELWDSPPFEPVISEGRIYARGAADMKGNLLLSILAVEAVLAAEGKLPVNVKFLFEGQEEIGSRDLGPYVSANRDKLACDLILTPDSLQWAEDQPVMWMGVKGMCGLQIDLETAGMDLHSGLYGGAVPNALHVLVELLGTLRNSQGEILVEGFYSEVVALSPDERTSFAEIPFDPASYAGQLGVDALVGEPGYTTYERAWARPTIEINGLWGGYQGDGVKTVIPAKAHAKITCRLVADQEPSHVLDSLESHLLKHRPAGARLTITRQSAIARAYRLPMDHPGTVAVAGVLADVYGRKPYFARLGGSLPITDMFLQELKAYTIPVGFALDDERIHSPNEFMRLESYHRGQIVYGLLLEKLGRLETSTVRLT